jgi:Na+:H+ antiporter, NhaA family
MTRHVRIPVLGRALAPVGSDFVSIEALGGVALLVGGVAAFVWANAAGGSYDNVWGTRLSLGWAPAVITADLQHWINDGLMTVFFFVVGLEIKRELVCGELQDRRKAALPAIAALGGMVVPALLYVAVTLGGSGSGGWGIPMATDIAFAMVVLGVLGSRAPGPLRLFLLSLAIVDDIGAVLVIALFYSHGISPVWLGGALAVVVAILIGRRFGVGHPAFYIVPALALWVCVHESGVHATIAGVVLGLLTPVGVSRTGAVGQRLEQLLHPWSSLLVIPLFALANSGVSIDAAALQQASTSPVTWGVIVGLVVGKPLGIVVATMSAVRLGAARLPAGLSLRRVVGAGILAGMGFTVSLFVAELAFQGPMLGDAKIGILVASLLSGVVGAAWLWSVRSAPAAPGERELDRQTSRNPCSPSTARSSSRRRSTRPSESG